MPTPSLTILIGDAAEQLATLPDASVHCVVTSPPYWGLRDYGVPGQIGLENTLPEYLAKLLPVFAQIWRVLRPDGTLWVNMGDCYANPHQSGPQGHSGQRSDRRFTAAQIPAKFGWRPKSLVGQPWRLAFALQDAGWILRQDIIWHKPNPMPESVTDRCTKAHEYLFLLTKSPRYFFHQAALLEPCSPGTHGRISQDLARQIGSFRANGGGKTNGPMKAVVRGSTRKLDIQRSGSKMVESFATAMVLQPLVRNKRSVWTISTQGYRGAHFATFPEKLVRPCIAAGCPENGTVLDPFGGSGTTAKVALELGRSAILVELNPAYAQLARARCQAALPQAA